MMIYKINHTLVKRNEESNMILEDWFNSINNSLIGGNIHNINFKTGIVWMIVTLKIEIKNINTISNQINLFDNVGIEFISVVSIIPTIVIIKCKYKPINTSDKLGQCSNRIVIMG